MLRKRRRWICSFANATLQSRHRHFSQHLRESGRDMTPQQDSLSGVIICPAEWRGQRL